MRVTADERWAMADAGTLPDARAYLEAAHAMAAEAAIAHATECAEGDPAEQRTVQPAASYLLLYLPPAAAVRWAPGPGSLAALPEILCWRLKGGRTDALATDRSSVLHGLLRQVRTDPRVVARGGSGACALHARPATTATGAYCQPHSDTVPAWRRSPGRGGCAAAIGGR